MCYMLVAIGSMCNRVSAQGTEALRGACDGGSATWGVTVGVPSPGVFWQKRLQPIENEGKVCRKERKETT